MSGNFSLSILTGILVGALPAFDQFAVISTTSRSFTGRVEFVRLFYCTI